MFFCSILQVAMYIGMQNLIINFFFYILFIQTKINEQTKHNKTVVKIHESH